MKVNRFGRASILTPSQINLLCLRVAVLIFTPVKVIKKKWRKLHAKLGKAFSQAAWSDWNAVEGAERLHTVSVSGHRFPTLK